MKAQLQALVTEAVAAFAADTGLEGDLPPVQIERPRDPSHGDFASNIALAMAKQARCNPRELAQNLVDRLSDADLLESVEIAGPGFINFRLAKAAFQNFIADILTQRDRWLHSGQHQGKKALVEFVSANPTGPLHVGHGRGAAYGDSLARLLQATGYKVEREYYINDAGRQMDILATSVWLRYLQAGGETIAFPSAGYQGDYIVEAASELRASQAEQLMQDASIFADVPADAIEGSDSGDKEAHIDGLIATAKSALGEKQYVLIRNQILDSQVASLQKDLGRFDVPFDHWFSERSLVDSGAVAKAIEQLNELGHCYIKDGATWFRSTDFGDEKDRVIVRENGVYTYFATDIAYHLDKIERGYDRLINVWGADHHGYIARVRAAVSALTENKDELLDIRLVQFVSLFRNGERVAMSTRKATYDTLGDLCEEVGVDAARFFYVSRSNDQHLDFDLGLAVSQSNDNPVYYIQYAFARVCAIFRQLEEQSVDCSLDNVESCLHKLSTPQEIDLLKQLLSLRETLVRAADAAAPHVWVQGLRDLADAFHRNYGHNRVLVDDEELRRARIALFSACGIVLSSGLALLGVSAPDRM